MPKRGHPLSRKDAKLGRECYRKAVQARNEDNVDRSHCFVVDDEPVICNTLVAILSHAGYAATAFEDPKLAVKADAEMAQIC